MRRDLLCGRSKSISVAGQCFNEPRIFSRIFQALPKSFDRGIDAVVEVYEAIGPKAVADLLPRHNFTRMLHQEHQELKKLFRQADLQAFLTDFSRSPVELNSPGQDLQRYFRSGHSNAPSTPKVSTP